jgi:bacteriorhodopsin
MEHPIQYVAKVEHGLDQLIHDDGDYLFMGFALVCFVAIVWLLSRKRKSLPTQTASARTRAIVGIMLASPGMSSDADGGRTRLIMGDDPTRRTNALNSDTCANE